MVAAGLGLERHFELDPRTAMFERVDSGRFAIRSRLGPVKLGPKRSRFKTAAAYVR